MKALNNILSGHSADELDKLFVSDPQYAEFLKYVNWRKIVKWEELHGASLIII